MARCFPFPPPGFAREDSSNEALILSIKLQRENEKAKSSDRKKEKKREKEKKRQKGGKSNYAVGNEKQKLVEKLYLDDKCEAVSKDKLYQDDKYRAVSKDKCCLREEDESELLEKSSVTEEHGQPIDMKNASCSSDSTGNSSKRRRPSTPPNSIQSHGNIIRIRLSSSHKSDEPSTSGRKEQEINVPLQKREDRSTPSSYNKVVRPCSNFVTEASNKQKDVIVNVPPENSNFASTSNATATFQLASSLPEKKIESRVIKEKLSSHEKKMLKRESQYKKLLESWVSPVIPSDLVVDEGDDEDWLFGKKDEERPAKRSQVGYVNISNGDNLLSCASFDMHPRAHFLPDVQIYALPFTAPF